MEVIQEVLTDQNFIGAILGSIVFIFLGFLLRNRGVLKEGAKDVLNVLVLDIAIPCMAFCAFMSDFKEEEFLTNIVLFVYDLAFYLIFILLGNLLFLKKDKTARQIYALLLAVGQLTLFSMPILKEVYGSASGVLIPTSLMSVDFRLVVYIYGYLVISEQKITKQTFWPSMKRIFVTPVMILMFLGFLIWVTQGVFPKVEVDGTYYSALRIDKTLPALYMVFHYGDVLATPLSMFLIGVTLGSNNVKTAFKNKTAWLIAIMKMVVVPGLFLALTIGLQAAGLFHFNEIQLAALIIGNAAPVGAVLAVFCVNYNKESYVASDAVMLSTVLSVITLPLYFVFVKLAVTLPMFA